MRETNATNYLALDVLVGLLMMLNDSIKFLPAVGKSQSMLDVGNKPRDARLAKVFAITWCKEFSFPHIAMYREKNVFCTFGVGVEQKVCDLYFFVDGVHPRCNFG